MSKSPKDTKGPVVKTGPTKGQNRSRNDDGQWRAKRSDAGKSRPSKESSGGKKKGCFITTAACEIRGLPDDCAEMTTLRAFRDQVLIKTPDGAAIVEEYYTTAPSLVPLVRGHCEREQVWSDIQETVALIRAGADAEAIVAYRRMYDRLCRKSRN